QQQRGIDQRRRNYEVARYEGRVPTRFKVRQFLSQWTPQLNRRFTITRPDDQPNGFDWKKFADSAVYRPDTIAAGAPRDALLNDVRQAFGQGTHVAVFIGGKRQDLLGNFSFLQSGNIYGIDPYGNQLAQP